MPTEVVLSLKMAPPLCEVGDEVFSKRELKEIILAKRADAMYAKALVRLWTRCRTLRCLSVQSIESVARSANLLPGLLRAPKNFQLGQCRMFDIVHMRHAQ